MKKRVLALILCITLGGNVLICSASEPEKEQMIQKKDGSHSYIIVTAADKSSDDIILDKNDQITDIAQIGDKTAVTVQVAGTDSEINEKIQRYAQDPALDYVQENYEYDLIDSDEVVVSDDLAGVMSVMEDEKALFANSVKISSANDARYSEQYYLQSGMKINQAWEILSQQGNGNKVKVAVIDTGVNRGHEDLQSNINANLSYDVVNDSAEFSDLNGHGTHVAGIIGATANNQVGIAGAAFNHAEIICYNSFHWNYAKGKPSSYSSDILKAYERAIRDGAKVINMSLGGYHSGSTSPDIALREAIDEANRKGIVTVCSAGNGGKSDFIFPSDIDGVISVVATDKSDSHCSFSDFNQYKDIAASGDGIISTHFDKNVSEAENASRYALIRGTSQAAPIVSSVIAMMMYVNPNLSTDQIKNILYTTARDIGNDGRDDYYGYGLINAQACVEKAVALKSVRGSAQIQVTNETAGSDSFDMIIKDISSTYAITKVETTAYSKADNSNKYVYSYQKQDDGTFFAKFNYNNHIKDIGKYYFDTVMYDSGGNVFTLASFTKEVCPVYKIFNQSAQFGQLKVPATGLYTKEIEVTALPDQGYSLDRITVLSNSNRTVQVVYTGKNSVKFVMPEEDVEVKATFKKQESPGEQAGGETSIPRIPSEQAIRNVFESPTTSFADYGTIRVDNGVFIAGSTRVETSLLNAEAVKTALGTKAFSSIIVADSRNFPDGLTASQLAVLYGAPVLLVNPSKETRVLQYMKENLTGNGKVYISGGTGVVSPEFERGVKNAGYTVERLAGVGRYDTNLEILREGMANGLSSEELLVVSGENFADALSVSATGKPILIVGDALTTSQKEFLTRNAFQMITVIGGEGAVKRSVATEIEKVTGKSANRIGGKGRIDTSKMVATAYFPGSPCTVYTKAGDFADGISGGLLANTLGAPMKLSYDVTDRVESGQQVMLGGVN